MGKRSEYVPTESRAGQAAEDRAISISKLIDECVYAHSDSRSSH